MAKHATNKLLGLWLFLIAVLVLVMAVIGAVTRLTESGLSIMEWAPITGILPPLSEAEWQRLFALYQQTPEYLEQNRGMTAEQFRSIFWWEYIHRLWGRLIGLVFLVPALWFWWRGHVKGAMRLHLPLLFILGAAQGGLGWFMVASGFAERVDVSQYRLAAHLTLALLIFAYALWLALSQIDHTRSVRPRAAPLAMTGLGLVLLALTLVAGAFVAGLNAGLIYNEVPLMGGAIIPGDYRHLDGFFANAFENPVAAQLHHRVLALAVLLFTLALVARAERRLKGAGYFRLPYRAVGLIVLIQFALGVWTLLAQVPVALGAAHQAGGFLLLACYIWALYRNQANRA